VGAAKRVNVNSSWRIKSDSGAFFACEASGCGQEKAGAEQSQTAIRKAFSNDRIENW